MKEGRWRARRMRGGFGEGDSGEEVSFVAETQSEGGVEEEEAAAEDMTPRNKRAWTHTMVLTMM